ncbi:MAG: hypothetical protein FJ054_02395 [Cyanobacteria bacterium M_surface_10_m2_119]|nr:hypothetical protein [Cyanobacteria bacterium M_surface_10_m2_119]
MRRLSLIGSGFAVALAGGLVLTGCDQASQSVKDAATGAVQTAIGPAVAPVLDLLKQGQSKVAAGDLAGATASMGGFQAVWDKAAPVIKPLAGDKWTGIETAAQGITNTFAKDTLSAADANAAIGGLIGPLSALAGK